MASRPSGIQRFLVPGTAVEVDATPKGFEIIGAPSLPYVFQAAGNAVRITIEHHRGAPPIIYSCTGGRDVEAVTGTGAEGTTQPLEKSTEQKEGPVTK